MKAKSWRDEPLSNGKTPRDVLRSVAIKLQLSDGDIHYILNRADKVKDSGNRSSVLYAVLASAYLYVRYSAAGRFPHGRTGFCKICKSSGLNIEQKQLLRWSRKLVENRIYLPSLSPLELFDRVSIPVRKKLGLPTHIDATIRQMLANGVGLSGRKPEVVVATAIYLSCRQKGIAVSQDDVAEALDVTSVSIRSCIPFFEHSADRP